MPELDPNRDPQQQRPQTPRPFGRFPRSALGWLAFLGCAVVLMWLLVSTSQKTETLTFDEMLTCAKNGQIDSAVIKVDVIEIKTHKPLPNHTGRQYEIKSHPELTEMVAETFEEYGVRFENDVGQTMIVQILLGMLPWLLIFAVIWFFVIRQLRQAGGGAGMLGNFGRSRHRITTREHTNITFADVAGIEDAKEEVNEIVEFLKNPRRFQKLGGRIPRGVLLVGDPGCGKTLLAKAIAGEADVPFFSISGSDFVEMFVGVGASRVRDLFKQAKDNAPCIVFLDEIDAVGRRRGAGFNGGGHDEREQTLNAILVEMDGFDTNEQIIVIAATNREDVLDPALTRPGRFDRRVYVPLPDIKGRLGILKVHARRIKLAPDVDLERLARGTPLFSGADLAAIINESALLATMANKDAVEQIDLEEARDKVRWGRARKSRVIDESEKVATAYHEAGHALVQSLVPEADPLHKVSIIPRGNMGGATFALPEKDRSIYTRKYCMAMMQICFGGRVAEEVFCGDISSGAAMDFRQATEIARRMVSEWGMSDKVGVISYGDDGRPRSFLELSGGRDYSDRTAELIDDEIRRFTDQAYQATDQLIRDHADKVKAIAEALLKYETLDADEVDRIIRGESLDKPSVSELLAAETDQKPEKSAPVARPAKHPPAEPDLPPAVPEPG